MSRKRDNETIRRLDRFADQIGLKLSGKGNKRQFDLKHGRVIRFQPGGKGVLKVEAAEKDRTGAWVVDARSHCGIERVERLMATAVKGSAASEDVAFGEAYK